MKRFPMTLRGVEKLREELINLKNIKRPQIISDLAAARDHGDLKENAEYHAAREQQSFCEGRIKEIEAKLSNAQIIDITKIPVSNRVVFGSTITLLNILDNKIYRYRIVGDDEADHKDHFISLNSPLARGLIGKEVNENVIIKTPKGDIIYKISNVEYV
ncbi:MAG: transcription elongation factor GreA [Candidatus Dasytiphilus stammeri]